MRTKSKPRRKLVASREKIYEALKRRSDDIKSGRHRTPNGDYDAIAAEKDGV